ncbi:hypothetical protein GCM10009838_63980 [Catenulispora subtropica]|uniref:Uncharacterized protein n=1 Tax=Catenulispora subtropica TaxID=450798 RepID=A0ABP5E6P3_9ACTN
MSDPKARLAQAVVEAREAKGWSGPRLARAAGSSTATIRAFKDAGTGFRGGDCARYALEEALGWTPGSAAALLGGHEALTVPGLDRSPRPSE